MVLALIAIGFLAFGFVGASQCSPPACHDWATVFYTAASMVIAVPSGVQIFCWIATLWAGRPRFSSPLLFVIGFVVVFVLGGLTGVDARVRATGLQLHDTYFVVAHFHYVLIGGAVFPLFAGLYFLVSQTDRPHAERAPRRMEFLGTVHRVQPDVLSHALPGARRHATSHLYVC